MSRCLYNSSIEKFCHADMNSILGVLARVSPQLNMFAVGIQFKIVVGLSVLLLSMSMLPSAANFVFQEMKEIMTDFVGGMM